ncbi:MAG: hypothetical protein AB1782_13475 [Cyanobacteriota bacterium]
MSFSVNFYSQSYCRPDAMYGLVDQTAQQGFDIINGAQQSYPQNQQPQQTNFLDCLSQMDQIINPTIRGGIDFDIIGQLILGVLFPQVDPVQQQKIQMRQEIHERLNQIAETRDQIFSGEVQDPQQIQKRLEALQQVEKALIKNLKETYPEDSPQAQALEATLGVMDAEQKMNAIKSQLNRLLSAAGALMNQLANVNPSSPEAQAIKARIEAIINMKNALEEKLVEAKEDYAQHNADLMNNLMGCPRADRQIIADIRADQFHSQGILHQKRVEDLNTQVEAIKEYLENPNISDDVRQRLLMQLEITTQSLKAEQGEALYASFNEFALNIMKF